MRLKTWTWYVCAALIVAEAFILFFDYVALSVLPKGGTIEASTYFYIAAPVLLFALAMVFGRR